MHCRLHHRQPAWRNEDEVIHPYGPKVNLVAWGQGLNKACEGVLGNVLQFLSHVCQRNAALSSLTRKETQRGQDWDQHHHGTPRQCQACSREVASLRDTCPGVLRQTCALEGHACFHVVAEIGRACHGCREDLAEDCCMNLVLKIGVSAHLGEAFLGTANGSTESGPLKLKLEVADNFLGLCQERSPVLVVLGEVQHEGAHDLIGCRILHLANNDPGNSISFSDEIKQRNLLRIPTRNLCCSNLPLLAAIRVCLLLPFEGSCHSTFQVFRSGSA